LHEKSAGLNLPKWSKWERTIMLPATPCNHTLIELKSS
jgi:hypothetical protein